MLLSLKDRYEEALRRNDVKAIVVTGNMTTQVNHQLFYSYNCFLLGYDQSHIICNLSGARGKFSGGFDVTAFGGLQGGKSKRRIYITFSSSYS